MHPAFFAILILRFLAADAYQTGNHLAGANGRNLGPGSDFQPNPNEKPPTLDELLAGNKPMHDTHPESHLKSRKLNKKMAHALKVVHNGEEVEPAHPGVHQDYISMPCRNCFKDPLS